MRSAVSQHQRISEHPVLNKQEVSRRLWTIYEMALAAADRAAMQVADRKEDAATGDTVQTQQTDDERGVITMPRAEEGKPPEQETTAL